MQRVDGGISRFSNMLCDPRNGGGVSQSRVGGEGRGAGDSPRSDASNAPGFQISPSQSATGLHGNGSSSFKY